ncbi:LPS export ABC transporter permease LptG [Rhodospirillaceae bacterium KN72]|uniref:LPS export ABC transporter permease LptG n=1 Tax=Pacificispira spongiicola TaxID=2729598 RepID=A0A7Y0E315_9PROT|nr:LPS export ABC transporter permease LptG [Pacificispira spongiicola]NMM46289.1 LPS export ABC transporter permease LptG [Pacificispira spongiicola]
MRIPAIFSLYLSRHFLLWLAGVFATLLAIVAMFDIVELLRKGSAKEEVTTEVLIQMSLLKLPHLVQDMLPFAVLLGGMMCFWRLARANELVVARAAGVSAWQFLTAPIIITFITGVLLVTIFNPFAAAMRANYEAMESKYLGKNRAEFAVSETGVWLRQGSQDEQDVIHADKVVGAGDAATLEDVVVLELEAGDRFVGRIDAANAVLRNGYWELNSAYLSQPGADTRFVETYRLGTNLTMKGIQDSFASADTLSFWELPRFIGTMEEAGFNANAHRLYLHSLLATPVLLCAMVLIAAIFSIRTSRRSSTGMMVVGGVLSGFLLYFFTNVVHALGLSMSIPAEFAAWTPAGVSTMLGVTALLHLEDG